MTSILTNVAAMSALQTLRGIGQGMEETQARVSSGLRVGEASDNAAYWSIATTMKSDNGALSAVQDALGLGAAKVDTAYAGLESSIDVIEEIKNKLVASREAGVDRTKIQEEITQLQDQLKSISDSASFSGENWLKASVSAAPTAADEVDNVAELKTVTKQVVGSFTRDSSGNVKVQTVDVKLDSTNVLFDTSGNKMGILDQDALKANVGKVGDNYYTAVKLNDPTEEGAPTYFEGDDGVWTTGEDGSDSYIQVDEGKWVLLDETGVPDEDNRIVLNDDVFATGTSVTELDISDMSAMREAFGVEATASDEDVIDLMISFIDRQLESATSAAADMGSVSMRLGLQEDFVTKLSDSIDSGVGRLVDADMNEESTRLKALQTQQQLGVQALSIANSASESILSLFR
ncbi:flagellin [Aliirhizobium terrae]|uniref:flagellin N-terminal helical domain-containing protein n=1 Tax=Terrirhizobium terrae TaxID=2926709 RepID=UPI002577BF99|nr:flagellin [Rhizobium sp. CC-CFT758]WJH38993.1 flagellin [Rhizobium sp. CC-CFT758]